ncbi:hypothetical protein LCGC14_2300700 [marine sediment metagenome]|uniref:Uncharacterized protein n=1 Tax=marine sediment metagenome TaxID=412755 RepID=A0A0F9FII3_9ZZZZ
MEITLDHYLTLAAILFAIGLYGVLAKRNIILILIAVEFMLSAANINLVAISRFVEPGAVLGQIFAIFVMIVTAAEIGVGLGIVVYLYRAHVSIENHEFDVLKG